MKNAKRGRGSFRLFSLCVVAGLGVALSACGGSGDSTSAASSAAAALAPTSVASSSAAPAPTVMAVTLNWMPPTENTDGTVLSNLAGYDIYYGTQRGDYTNTITVDNPGIATYVVDNLSPGTYYFVVTAYNSQGAQSPMSSEVSATVD